MCRNGRRNSITSREHAFTKMHRAKIIQTQISVFALTIDSGARLCRRAHCVVGVGRSVRRSLDPRFTEHRHHTTPPKSPFYSALRLVFFNLVRLWNTRPRARVLATHRYTRAHIRTRSHVHTYYTQLLRTNNFLTRVLCYICIYI